MPKREPSPLEILLDQVNRIEDQMRRLGESVAGLRDRVGSLEGQLQGERHRRRFRQQDVMIWLVFGTALLALLLFIVDRVGALLGWWS